MSIRLSTLVLLALVGCGTTQPHDPADPPEVDDTGIDDPEGADFVEQGDFDQLEAPGPDIGDPVDKEAWTEAPVEEEDEAFLGRQLLIQVAPGVDLGEVAVRHGTKAAEAPDARGYGSVVVPQDVEPADLLADLLSDPDVADAGRMGLVVGSVADGWAVEYQWHHKNVRRLDQEDLPVDVGDITVAILDTGVAYEDYTDPQGQRYLPAPTLEWTKFVAPWDFVNDDAHPNDDHQHGTHLASLIASQGEVAGVAPGVQIMPVKVLDDRKRGTELSLVRGIDYAVENGADVINLSLSFPVGYLPSPLLQRALQDADAAGVIMVGAAGNDGVNTVTWPAASPHVIAVGASDEQDELAPYSNWGAALDVLAPGGDLTADQNGDGLPDGIIGETIALQDPGTVGLWLVEGTSQATALVSGIAALRLAEHRHPDCLDGVLHAESRGPFDPAEGLGVGVANLEDTVNAATSPPLDDYHAIVRPFLVDWGGNQLQPGVRVTVLDDDGRPVRDETAFGTFSGSSQATWSCETDDQGVCTDLLDTIVADPVLDAVAWVVTVDGVADDDKHIRRPRRAVLASDALDVLTAAMDAEPDAAGSALMFLDDPGLDPVLDRPLAGVYVAMDLGSGLMSSPMGLIATPPALAPRLSKRVVPLDVDGTGLMSSPMGIQTLVLATLTPPSDADIALDGSGLLSSPMLGFRPSMAVLGSSGPLGFGIHALVEPGAAPALDVTDAQYAGELVRLDEGSVAGAKAEDTALSSRLEAGAWQQNGFGAASAVAGSGQVSVTLEGSATTAAAVELTE